MAKKNPNPYQNNKAGELKSSNIAKESKKVAKITASKGKDLRNGK